MVQDPSDIEARRRRGRKGRRQLRSQRSGHRRKGNLGDRVLRKAGDKCSKEEVNTSPSEKLDGHRDLPGDGHRGPLVPGQSSSIIAVGQEVNGGGENSDREVTNRKWCMG